jgi:oligopeptide transport system substrate-binding protein
MTTAKLRRLLGAMLVSALVLAGCSGGGTEGDDTDVTDSEAPADDTEATDEPADDSEATDEAEPTDAAEGEASDAIVSTYIGQPESLTPTNNTESEGSAVLDALFTKLIDYDNDSGEPVMANAESIETEDNQTYTVTLKEGWTFHDGTPVTAESYVNAWNYAANGANAQSVAGFFVPIAGYDEVQCGTAARRSPTARAARPRRRPCPA